jgi:HD-GYP domain-containing protein (c-di-GMP phosphodiesterase class II)
MTQAEYTKKIFRILYFLRIIVNNARLYGLKHYQVEQQVGQVFKEIISSFSVKPEITLLLIENELIINNKAIRAEEQKNFTLFVKILKKKEVGFVTLSKGMKKSEFRQFLEYLAAPEEETIQPFSGSCIKVGKVGLKEEQKRGTGGGSGTGKGGRGTGLLQDASQLKGKYRDEEIKQALAVLNSIATDRLDIIKEYYDKIERHRQFDCREVEGVISVFVKCFASNMNPLAMLSTLKESDEYTFTHAVNVCILTLAQASTLGFSQESLLQIGIASSLHDVGKIFIPTELLNKAGKLSPEEREVIETHPAKGASYIVNLQNISQLAILGALEHHIRYDGGGYPNTGGKWKTHIVSQMISIADTFDAMRSHRPYQKAKPVELIFKVLREGKGTAFSPMLVDNFIKIVSSQPQYS